MLSKNPKDISDEMKTHQMQVFKEFDSMNNKIFGGFYEMMGFGPMKSILANFEDIHKEMRDMTAFSKIGNMMESSKNGPAKVMTKSYVQATKLDSNGNKYTENYFSNNFAMRGDDGTTMSERQQAYQNSLNKQEKIAEERMLNNKGKKLVQERIRGGPVNKTQHFYNLDENRVPDFDRDWNHYSNKFGFNDAFGKMLAYDGGQNRINYPSRNDYFPKKKNYNNEDPADLNNQPENKRDQNNDLQPKNLRRSLPMSNRDEDGRRFDALPLEGPR